MLIFVEARLVLLAVPKTGTTALEQVLAPDAAIVFRARPEIKHLTLRQYLQSVQPLLRPLGGRPFQTVAAIREPLDWLRSWYRFRARDAVIGHPNSTARVSFQTFVEDYLREGDRPAYARLGRQSQFLAGPDGQPAIDHLFRYESMPALAAFLAQRLGRNIDLPRLNASPPAHTDLPPEVEARLRRELAAEYDLWQQARQAP
ncbi:MULTISPECIES: gamma-glutamyl kinase [unclassified Paracoccus (in: a-proteobacteria)]|uniref:gamma-glutamyl kinase n=1 Tax=unclassified Paracoccus (in: a-proteobacteria) TaxID=2688777 RepID=UPI0012B27E4D|nr:MULTISPECIES: gamma-glutamyl kinase [unclassified Paracoccus (in: a-proteobacteria)]UXU73891.1 gamma-glutamyl kinase [Paracoccus sp. SMMA_5]UXU79779.1 gamma-glutamyl kinase [Paracoccus sp. SMMA_5_TC]